MNIKSLSCLFLCFLGCTVLQSQNMPPLQWVLPFENPHVAPGGNDNAKSMAVDAQGNKYVVGIFFGTIDFDPSPASYTLCNTSPYTGFYFAKYSLNGSLVWAHHVDGADASLIRLNSAGDVIISGKYITADFDPSAATYSLACTGFGDDIFFAKYTAATGSFVFVKSISGPAFETASALALDAADNIFVAGVYSNNTDFDPSSAVASFTSASTDLFFAKYDPSGNYVFGKTLEGGTKDCGDIQVDASGNILLTGQWAGSLDFDPAAATFTIASPYPNFNTNNIYIAKYTSQGNLSWVSPLFGDNINQFGNALTTDNNGNIYLTGSFFSGVDFDPSPATYTLASWNCTNDVFFAKYDTSGSLVFVKQLSGGGTDMGTDIERDASGNIFITGFVTGTIDYDPSPNTVFLLQPTGATPTLLWPHTTAVVIICGQGLSVAWVLKNQMRSKFYRMACCPVQAYFSKL